MKNKTKPLYVGVDKAAGPDQTAEFIRGEKIKPGGTRAWMVGRLEKALGFPIDIYIDGGGLPRSWAVVNRKCPGDILGSGYADSYLGARDSAFDWVFEKVDELNG